MSNEEYRVSFAECLQCGYVWIAVVPDECVASLECPACHHRWGIEPPEGHEVGGDHES